LAKLDRQTQLIFASAAGNRELTAFGTAKTDSPEFTTDAAAIQNSNYLQGWNSALLADKAPYEEDTNALLYMITRQLAYLYQTGIAEYDSATEYYTGNVVSAADGSGNWYKSLTDNNIGNPLSDTGNWKLVNLNKRQLPLFTQITLDYALQNEDAAGWALQGSLVNGNVYPDAFNKILSLYNSGSAASYRGINAVLTSDGRYITPLNNKNAVDNLFNSTGIADIYVLDTSTQSFYLPKNSAFVQYTIDAGAVNKYNPAGLPAPNITISGGGGTVTTSSAGSHTHTRGTMNITGSIAGMWLGGITATKVFKYTQRTRNVNGVEHGVNIGSFALEFDASAGWTGSTSTAGAHTHTVTLGDISASASGGLYGISNTVQPASSTKLLYYLVGDTAA